MSCPRCGLVNPDIAHTCDCRLVSNREAVVVPPPKIGSHTAAALRSARALE